MAQTKAFKDSANTRQLGAYYRQSIHPQKVSVTKTQVRGLQQANAQEVSAPLKPAPELRHGLVTLDGGKVVLEHDIAIPMRDGIRLYANVYRPIPDIAIKTPAIVLFAPFGKHGAVPREKFANMDVDFSKLSKYAMWELPDPLRWCADFEYSLVVVDPRGTWWSEGSEANYLSPEEGRDGYDIVEWIAEQEWCTGNVGWGAVSYFAMSAYHTAVLKPPHLRAIMPWEGISDIYREVNCPGGIPNVAFQQLWMDMTGNGLGESEDHAVASIEHPMFDKWWQSKVVDWSLIEIPALSVTGWSSLGLHLRGTIEAWKHFSSKDKYLIVHGGREWSEFYKEHNIEKQKAFFDRYLKGASNEVQQWPKVQYDVRSAASISTRQSANEFPPQAQLVRLYLQPLQLQQRHNTDEQCVCFEAHQPDSMAVFDHKFEQRTEVTGYASLKIFVQALKYPDVDLYVALQKLDREGSEVKFYHSTQQIEAPAALGWLRLSHRELDIERSRPEQPYHKHQCRQWVRPQDIVEADIEIWPSSTVWEAGETLRLVIKGSPFTNQQNLTQVKGPSHGHGEVRIWMGSRPSSLLIPMSINSHTNANSLG